MKFIILVLLGWISLAVAAVPTYDQKVAQIRAEHARVITKECTPKKRPDMELCRHEANESLMSALRDLRKQHEREKQTPPK